MDIFAAVLTNFNRRFFNTTLYTFWTISSEITVFWLLKRSAPLVLVRPRLKSAAQLLTVLNDGAESGYVEYIL